MSVSDHVLRVLQEKRLNSRSLDSGWMKRSEIFKEVYGERVTINAHHRTILKDLEHSGEIVKRVRTSGMDKWFEYKDNT